MVLYALVGIEQNSSKIDCLHVYKQYLVGNTFPTNAEVDKIVTSFFAQGAKKLY